MSAVANEMWGVEMNDDIVSFLDLHYFHIGDVEDEIEKHLNQSFLEKYRYVALVHGFGTGRLRQVVHEYLDGHPLVAGYWLSQHRGNAGALTYVKLKK